MGRDKARTTGPPSARRRTAKAAPPRPPLPTDEEPDLPRAVRRDIDRLLGKGKRADDVALALSIAGEAIDEGRTDIARELLAWAKHEAPRVPAVREAYGIACYLEEDYQTALSELSTYRRLTGRVDQNHVIGDCLRALGRETDRVIELAGELVDHDEAPLDRRLEAAIVWAGAVADGGDVAAGRAVLRRTIARFAEASDEQQLRLWSFAADLAQRDGDLEEAASHLRSMVSRDPTAYDAGERLRQLTSGR